MKLLYTHDDRLLVGHVKNVVESAGFEVRLKNDILSGAVGGGASPLDVWLEVWIIHDNDYDEALKLVQDILSEQAGEEWVCSNCEESNGPSFEICWKCQAEKPEAKSSSA